MLLLADSVAIGCCCCCCCIDAGVEVDIGDGYEGQECKCCGENVGKTMMMQTLYDADADMDSRYEEA